MCNHNAVISLYGKNWHNTLYVNCSLCTHLFYLVKTENYFLFTRKQTVFFAPNEGMFVMLRRNVRRKNVQVRFVTQVKVLYMLPDKNTKKH